MELWNLRHLQTRAPPKTGAVFLDLNMESPGRGPRGLRCPVPAGLPMFYPLMLSASPLARKLPCLADIHFPTTGPFLVQLFN